MDFPVLIVANFDEFVVWICWFLNLRWTFWVGAMWERLCFVVLISLVNLLMGILVGFGVVYLCHLSDLLGFGAFW